MSLHRDSIGMRLLDAIGFTLGALLLASLLFVPDMLDQADEAPQPAPVVTKVQCA